MKHEEDDIQKACVTWFKLQYPMRLIWATPNGGSRNVREAARLKAQGVLAGVPDLFIPEPCGTWHGLFIEMKAGKNKQTATQKEIESLLLERNYNCNVCYSFDQFKSIVNNYFKL